MSKVLYKMILNTCHYNNHNSWLIAKKKIMTNSKEMVSSKLIHLFILIYLTEMSRELNVMFIMAIED